MFLWLKFVLSIGLINELIKFCNWSCVVFDRGLVLMFCFIEFYVVEFWIDLLEEFFKLVVIINM